MNKSRLPELFVLVFIALLLTFNTALTQPIPPEEDLLLNILHQTGLQDDQLGFSPKGYWTRYPDPNDIPFLNLAFNDLMADPLVLYDFVSEMAVAADQYLHPDDLANNNLSLLKAVYYTGVRQSTAQMRAYSASLWAEPEPGQPLVAAIREIYNAQGRTWRYNAMGQASDFPLNEEEILRQVDQLDLKVRELVAKTVLHLLHAHQWVETARRNVDPADMLAVWRIRRLGETQFDGLEYYPELEDCANSLDINSIYYAGSKLLQSGWELADTLSALIEQGRIDPFRQNLNISTPIGRIVIADAYDNVHQYSDAILVVDLGGNDEWYGAVGATASLDLPVSLAIDLSGHDRYLNEDEFLPSQGAAILGAGVLIDCKGNDTYSAKRLAQGASMLGYGVLADYDGDDQYNLWTSGQGASYFGIGVALDGAGDDRYRIHGDGQGYGGVGGVGALINRTGWDEYYAEPIVSDSVFRPDYHSENSYLNYSYAQGCGIGRRGDITDGHSWAGGMGILIDLYGNDRYTSANWSMGCGYWYGMGFLYDGEGDDVYNASAWSSGAGAHFAIGVHIDDAGDDEINLWDESAYGLAFGHDYSIALHFDRSGDDLYRVMGDGIGFAINMSQAFFIDLSGRDTYVTRKGRNYGWNNFDKYNPPPPGAFPHLFSDQVSLFMDLDGYDVYQIEDELADRHSDPRFGDDRVVLTPDSEQRQALSNQRYYGIGIDTRGDGNKIEAFRKKLAPANANR
ncbi:MAG TPA: hypothetical protein ENH10_05115 [Bacteroidetes bacterium]|nr:hypothetical protein BMS3Bbin04_01984 [bacterium BMS3Bbin04]HDO65397.1 hypothetical protein [Bacteroidota bacterium]HEX04522.1 hypothetical protein [Bacteroidota bacterium]